VVERPTLDGLKVPYPDSIQPAEVLANLKAAVEHSHLAEAMGIEELTMRRGELHARRILQVKSDTPPPGFLVVELEDLAGNPIASVAITRRGVILTAQDNRGRTTAGRSLDLDDAVRRARGRLGRDPLSVGYVYFDNVAEHGVSEFRPLVAVTTEQGAIYLNSKGEAFAEEGSLLVEEFGGVRGTRSLPVPAGVRHLRSLGQW
jgi:hypothetical protein